MSEWKKLLVANPSASDIASSPSSGKVLKVGSGGALEWSTDSGGSFTTSGTVASFVGTKVRSVINDNNAIGAEVSLYKNSTTPAINDVIGNIAFYANDWDSGESAVDQNEELQARILSKQLDINGGSGDSNLVFQTNISGTITDVLTLSDKVNISKELDFTGAKLWVSGTNRRIVFGDKASAYEGSRIDHGNGIQIYNSGDIHFQASGATTTIGRTAGGTQVYMPQKLGIGTSSPNTPIEIAVAGASIRHYNSGGTTNYKNIQWSWVSNNLSLEALNDAGAVFKTPFQYQNYANKFFFTGDIDMGTQKLSNWNALTSQGNLYLDNAGTIDSRGSGDLTFRTTDSLTNRMIIKNDGKISIGHSIPTTALDIQSGTASTDINLRTQDDTVGTQYEGARVRFAKSGDGFLGHVGYRYYSATNRGVELYSSNDINFKVNGADTNSVTIKNTGLVGIGTTPVSTSKMHIYGQSGAGTEVLHLQHGTYGTLEVAHGSPAYGSGKLAIHSHGDLAIGGAGTTLNLGMGSTVMAVLNSTTGATFSGNLELSTGNILLPNNVNVKWKRSTGAQDATIGYNSSNEFSIFNPLDTSINLAVASGTQAKIKSSGIEFNGSKSITTSTGAGVITVNGNSGVILQSGTGGGSGAISFKQGSTEYMRVHTDGNVGIGSSTAPADTLHVYKGSDGNSGMQIQSTGSGTPSVTYLDLVHADGTYRIQNQADKFGIYDISASAMRLQMDSSGNLGISESTPTEKLHVGGNVFTTGSIHMDTNNKFLTARTHYDTNIVPLIGLNGSSHTIIGGNGFMVKTGTGNELDNGGGNAKILGTLDSVNYKINGAQGSDGQVLTSTGSGVAWEAVPAVTSFTSTINASEGIALATTKPIYFDGGDNTFIRENGADNLQIYTGGTNALTINASQNVGIGTPNPTTNLHVNSSGSTYMSVDGATSSWQGFVFKSGGSTKAQIQNYHETRLEISSQNGSMRFGSLSGALTRLAIDSSGNVGIGIVNPSEKLEVYGNGVNTAIKIHEDAGTHEAKLHLRRGGSDWEIINNGNLTFEIEDSEKFQIKSNGNVGIGNNAPDAMLTIGDGSSGEINGFHIKGGTSGDYRQVKMNLAGDFLFKRENIDFKINRINNSYSGALRFVEGADAQLWKFGVAGSSNDLNIQDTSSNNVLYLKQGGNVGINTVSPNYQMELSRSEGGILSLRRTHTDITAGDDIGGIYFTGVDAGTSTASYVGAKILAECEGGQWGTNSNEHNAPTAINFYTQTDGNTDNLGTPSLKITPSGNADLTGNLDVGAIGDTHTQRDTSVTLYYGSGSYAGNIYFSKNNHGSQYQISANETAFNIKALKNDHTIRFSTTTSSATNERMRITGNGVGIGTTTPTATGSSSGILHIENTAVSSATQGASIRLSSKDGSAGTNDGHRLGVIDFAGEEDSSGTLKVGAKIEAFADNHFSTADDYNHAGRLVFSVQSDTTDVDHLATPVMIIKHNQLDLNTNVLANWNALQSQGGLYLDNSGYIDNRSASGDLNFRTTASLLNRMTIASGGNVGIGGATTPDRTLEITAPSSGDTAIHIDSGASAWIEIDRSATGQTSEIKYMTNGSTNFHTGVSSTNAGFGTKYFIGNKSGMSGASPNAFFVIETDGKVGIGANTADTQLHVEGTSITHSHGKLETALGVDIDDSVKVIDHIATRITTDNSAEEMFLDGSSTRLVIPSNTSWFFKVNVVAMQVANGVRTGGYSFEGVIMNDGGTVSMPSDSSGNSFDNPKQTFINEWGSSMTCTLSADDTNNSLKIAIKGVGNRTHWVADIHIVQTKF